MNIRKWLSLFFTTLIIGGAVGLVVGYLVEWRSYTDAIFDGKVVSFMISLATLFGTGCLFSILSQMGFFAYLTVHRIGLGMFGSASLWSKVQIVLIVFIFFDLVYFRYQAFATEHQSVLAYFILPAALLVVSMLTALWKKKETNHYAFVPTLFFMFVVTVIEWLPVLKPNDLRWIWIMGVTLITCNAYQVLILHRLIHKTDERTKEQKAL
ncbi:KinB signaling pathway activation protein [Scopulibacillus daqui]|uniref:KinB signaling pathway activation protein n=1 Tax=Scopulibacillus daqui TaxID=1469162 RepID=A0ABS2Q3M2_9BACL|nr:KinB-signaling pathway activation protein [Scopulibacillus daqui]MBM7646899.1 KinB signaling pathway activation protein [Scopulibacillus daqui]